MHQLILEAIVMGFSEEVVQQVWAKAGKAGDNDPNVWRKDQCGAWIGRAYYGNRNSQYGWEIDHIKPESEGTSCLISGLYSGRIMPTGRPVGWAVP